MTLRQTHKTTPIIVKRKLQITTLFLCAMESLSVRITLLRRARHGTGTCGLIGAETHVFLLTCTVGVA